MDDFFICKRKGCINPRDTKKYCRECADKINAKTKAKRDKRKSANKCLKCESKRLDNTSFCLYHYMKDCAKRATGNEKLGPLLYKKFLDQDKKCFYTKIPLQLGVNSSIDHIFPRIKYPELISEPWNLVWASRHVNSMKSDIDLRDFLLYCEMVSNNADHIRRWLNGE